MSSIERVALQDLLATCQTEDDFRAWDALKADYDRRRAAQPRWVEESLGDVAAFFGLSVQTVKQWRMETPPLPGQEGHWSLPEIVRWKLDRTMQSSLLEAQRTERLREMRLKNQLQEIQLQEKRGELLCRVEVESDLAIVASRLRNRIENFGYEAAQCCPDDVRSHVKAAVDQRVRIALKEFRDSLEEFEQSLEKPDPDKE